MMGQGKTFPEAACPSFATVSVENGVTALRVQARMAKWVKATLWAALAASVFAFAVLAKLAEQFNEMEGWSNGWILIAAAVCCIVLLIAFCFGLPCLAIASASGEVIFDGKKLHLKDRAASYEIPLTDIRSVRHVGYPGTRLEIDVSERPKRFFFRARKTAMELMVPDGRMEFFHMWEQPKVDWLVANTNRLLFPEASAEPAKVTDRLRSDGAVVSGHLYGKAKYALICGTIVVNVVLVPIVGRYGYLALSSREWPNVQGRVVHSLYEESSDTDENKHYTAEIKYTYNASYCTYTSEELGILRGADERIVRKIIQEHPEGSQITVYFNPSDPAESVVIPGIGPISLLFTGLGCLIFCLSIALLPTAFQSNTPAQAKLARRYKVLTNTRSSKLRELSAHVRWAVPFEAWQNHIRANKRANVAMGLRILACTGLALMAAHHWLAPLCPPDLPWNKISGLLMAFAGVSWVSIMVEALLMGRKPPTYAISADGVLIPSKDHPLIRWRTLASFSLGTDGLDPRFRQLELHYANGVTRSLTLPGGELDSLILADLSKRLPTGPPSPKSAPLKRIDWLAGFAATVAVVLGVGILLSLHARSLHGSLRFDWILISGFVAGPGTWLAIALRNRRAKPQLFIFAVVINQIATLGFLTLAMVMHLSRHT